MAIRKRGNHWQIDYTDPNGKRIRQSFSKKKDAEAELGKRKSLIAEGKYLDVKVEYKTTLAEVLKIYVENFRDQPSFANWKQFCIENFKTYFGEDRRLSEIKYVDCETYRSHLKTKLTSKGTLRTTATINREMAALRHIFTKAVEWGMIEKSPFSSGKSLQLKENNQRMRYLTEDEILKLLKACEPQPHLEKIVRCALNTGMRRRELLDLQWNQIRDGFIYLSKTKTNESRQIPINNSLKELFEDIRQERISTKGRKVKHLKIVELEQKSEYVFIYHGLKIDRIDKAFKNALMDAGIKDFKFHDLRHTFASHLVMKGASLKEVQELLGHKDIQMTMRYAHLSQEHKQRAVSLLDGLTATCHKSVTSKKNQVFRHPGNS